jgi:WD40 repeat protein
MVLAVAYSSFDKKNRFPSSSFISTKNWKVIRTKVWLEHELARINDIEALPHSNRFAFGVTEFAMKDVMSYQKGGVYITSAYDDTSDENIHAYTTTHGAGVTVLTSNPLKDEIATGTETGMGPLGEFFTTESVKIFNLENKKILANPLHGKSTGGQSGLAYSSDGQFLIVGSNGEKEPHVHIINASSNVMADSPSTSGRVNSIAMQKTGRLFAVSVSGYFNLGNKIIVVNCFTKKVRGSLEIIVSFIMHPH